MGGTGEGYAKRRETQPRIRHSRPVREGVPESASRGWFASVQVSEVPGSRTRRSGAVPTVCGTVGLVYTPMITSDLRFRRSEALYTVWRVMDSNQRRLCRRFYRAATKPVLSRDNACRRAVGP
jgi:hypothetical protein